MTAATLKHVQTREAQVSPNFWMSFNRIRSTDTSDVSQVRFPLTLREHN
jgi:hypothetical protein